MGKCSHSSWTISNFMTSFRIAESFGRKSGRCGPGTIPSDCGCWHRNALSRSISSVHQSAETLGTGHGNQCIFSYSLHGRNCGFGKSSVLDHHLTFIEPHGGCGRRNIYRSLVKAHPFSICRSGPRLVYQLQ